MKREMKQTAVEWLMEIDKSRAITIEEWQQAREMEKKQMCQFAFDYQDLFYNNGKVPPVEQYYNETFNINKK
jgi:TorA maturation chaperone TorD